MCSNVFGQKMLINFALKNSFVLDDIFWIGPDFVVCDEGHLLKNDSSKLSQAVNQIKTRRRIVLTGTPLQNNLIECKFYTNIYKRNLLIVCLHILYK